MSHRAEAMEAALVAALANIDGTGSYNHALTSVEEGLEPSIRRPLPFVCVDHGPEEIIDRWAGGGVRALRDELIWWYVRRDKSLTLRRQCNDLLEDTQRAIEADVTLGGTADTLFYVGWDPVPAGAELSTVGAVITYRVAYSYQRDDPDSAPT